MNREVDLTGLTLDRDAGHAQRAGPQLHHHYLTRYVLPAALLLGVLGLMAWGGRDLLFPPLRVRVVPVLVATAENQDDGTPLFQAAGWIEPRPTSVRVAALAPGVVEQLLVVEDQPVKKGEPIAELVRQDASLTYDRCLADQELRTAELGAAHATLDAAVERFEQPVHLEAILGEAEAQLAAIQTQLAGLPFETRRAESRLEFARQSYEGKSEAGGAISLRTVGKAQSEFEAAQSTFQELRGRVDSLERQSAALQRRRDALQRQLELRTEERRAREEAEANVQAAAARLRQAQVAVSQAKLALERMTIRAPIDGRVLHLVALPGSRLMMGQGHGGTLDAGTVCTLYRPDALQVRVDVRFADLPQVQSGQPVLIASPALADPLQGRVLQVTSQADIQKNTLQVKVAIDTPPAMLKPEMLVEVTFLASTAQDTPPQATEARLYVPQKLVRRDEAGSHVWVADQSAGRALKTRIELGSRKVQQMLEVVNGLDPTSRLVATSLDALRDGQRIVVTGEADELAGTLSGN